VSYSNILFMALKTTTDVKVDPSAIKQHFTSISIKIHCCRYWKLSEWEFNNLSFPFWRLYYNTIEGAQITFGDEEVTINESMVVLIPPYTSFSTSLKHSNTESLSGSRIESYDEYRQLKQSGMVDHLFIHFNLGFQYDRVQPGIYQFNADTQLKTLLDEIRLSTINNSSNFGFRQTMQIYQLIIQLVNNIPKEKRESLKIDSRVLKVIDYIDQHFADTISNDSLGKIASMAPNSLLRLFKTSTGFTLQQFLQNKRIEKAIILMHNQGASIDQIADACGFSDRQHFSKVFKRVVLIAPAQYRKMQAI
jgi:AraC-like DNA-binding protein